MDATLAQLPRYTPPLPPRIRAPPPGARFPLCRNCPTEAFRSVFSRVPWISVAPRIHCAQLLFQTNIQTIMFDEHGPLNASNQTNPRPKRSLQEGPLVRENRLDFAFSGESLWRTSVGNLWIKKLIEPCFLCCAVWLVSISIASEVRGTSIRERVRIVETERALRRARTRTKSPKDGFAGLLQDAWLVRARRLVRSNKGAGLTIAMPLRGGVTERPSERAKGATPARARDNRWKAPWSSRKPSAFAGGRWNGDLGQSVRPTAAPLRQGNLARWTTRGATDALQVSVAAGR